MATKRFRYGLQNRPFSADFGLSKCDWNVVISADKVYDDIKEKLGSGVRHGIITTNTKLDEEFIKAHELVDIDLVLDAKWLNILKVIDYLAKREKCNFYLTKAFFNQIEMSEDEFTKIIKEHGYDDADVLFCEREELVWEM